VRFRIEPNVEETRRASRLLARAIMPPNRAGWALGAVYLLSSLACIATLGDRAGFGIVISAGSVMAALAVIQAEARRRSRAVLERSPHAEEPYWMEIAEAGVRVSCDHLEQSYRWNGMARVTRTAEFYLFVHSGALGLALPRRILDPAADRELRESIRRWTLPGTVQIDDEETAAGG
jgi:hypothetical protein